MRSPSPSAAEPVWWLSDRRYPLPLLQDLLAGPRAGERAQEWLKGCPGGALATSPSFVELADLYFRTRRKRVQLLTGEALAPYVSRISPEERQRWYRERYPGLSGVNLFGIFLAQRDSLRLRFPQTPLVLPFPPTLERELGFLSVLADCVPKARLPDDFSGRMEDLSHPDTLGAVALLVEYAEFVAVCSGFLALLRARTEEGKQGAQLAYFMLVGREADLERLVRFYHPTKQRYLRPSMHARMGGLSAERETELGRPQFTSLDEDQEIRTMLLEDWRKTERRLDIPHPTAAIVQLILNPKHFAYLNRRITLVGKEFYKQARMRPLHVQYELMAERTGLADPVLDQWKEVLLDTMRDLCGPSVKAVLAPPRGTVVWNQNDLLDLQWEGNIRLIRAAYGDKVADYARTVLELVLQTGERPSDQAIATRLGCDVRTVRRRRKELRKVRLKIPL